MNTYNNKNKKYGYKFFACINKIPFNYSCIQFFTILFLKLLFFKI